MLIAAITTKATVECSFGLSGRHSPLHLILAVSDYILAFHVLQQLGMAGLQFLIFSKENEHKTRKPSGSKGTLITSKAAIIQCLSLPGNARSMKQWI